MLYDTIIIGAGPAGCAAAVYAARKKIKVILITQAFGGQSAISAEIENWIGDIKLSGAELAKKLEDHVREQEDIEILIGKKVDMVKKTENSNNFLIKLNSGEEFESKTIIVATGGSRRKLNIPGEQEFEGRGVAYCSTCDAPMFKNKNVAVVGSGNAGLEAVVDLLNYVDKIYLLDIAFEMRGDKILQEQVLKSGKLEFLPETKITEIYGNKFVEGIKYLDKNMNLKKMDVNGVFVQIGSLPNTDFLKDLVEKDNYNFIKVDKNQHTSQPGIFAAGDITDKIYKQNNIAAGEGAVAALAVFDYLRS